MHEALARGESSPLVYEIARPGKTVWFEGQAVPLSGGEKGNGRQVTWIARDITSQHRHKEDVRVLSNQLALTEERQRRAIAVELHDSLGQILATMARTASGREVLAQAKAGVAKAKTVDELRQAQAVLLPLEFDLTLEQTAEAIGVSTGWACRLRTQFIRNGGQRGEAKPIRGGRRRENMMQ